MIKRSARETFIKTKKLCNIYDIDVDKLLISKKEPYGDKVHLYFLGHYDDDDDDDDNDVIRSLCIKLPQIVIRQCLLRLMIIDY